MLFIGEDPVDWSSGSHRPRNIFIPHQAIGTLRFRMPKEKKREGFHSAAGLIRYFDSEDDKALKVNPWLVIAISVVLIAIVAVAQWQWG